MKNSYLMLVLAVVLAGPHIPSPFCLIAAGFCFISALGFVAKDE
jgi:hypothetical protein